jgi:flavin reductase (DIM6/NTAB) family NADH-FMN oxidoreductase RutF
MDGEMGRAQTGMDPRECRNAFGRFATGITVVTTVHEGEIYGMTANSFCSVSLDPPLVLIAADHGTVWHEKVSQSRRYGVSVLSAEQGDLSNHFAGRPQEGLEIPFVWKNDMPLLDGAIAHLVCRVVDSHPAGDHTLHIGQVEYLDYRDGDPLLFYTGTYEKLEANIWETSFWW